MPKDVCEQLREAVNESGKTVYRVAKDAGIKHQVLGRFMKRERDETAHTVSPIRATSPAT